MINDSREKMYCIHALEYYSALKIKKRSMMCDIVDGSCDDIVLSGLFHSGRELLQVAACRKKLTWSIAQKQTEFLVTWDGRRRNKSS